jgi:hypothetical protein
MQADASAMDDSQKTVNQGLEQADEGSYKSIVNCSVYA